MRGEILRAFQRFSFPRPAVGVKFSPTRPQGVEQIQGVFDLCELLVEAQAGKAFYATKENLSCVAPFLLGMKEGDPVFESGCVGPRLGAFKDAKANQRLYHIVPRLYRGAANYVAMSPLEGIPFDPDVVVFTTEVSQAEILLRALSYDNGRPWNAKGSTVMGCSWLLLYPHITGETNFTVTGFGFGMRARRLFPEGLVLLSVPSETLGPLAWNLEEMPWVPPSYELGREGHKRRVRGIVEEIKGELGMGS